MKLKKLSFYSLIVLLAMSFFELFGIPPEISLAKQILSLAFAFIVLYHLNLPQVLFGIKEKSLDFLYLLMSFCFAFPIFYIIFSEDLSRIWTTLPFYLALENQLVQFNTFMLAIGTLIAVIISFFLLNRKFKKSFVSIFTIRSRIFKFGLGMLILLGSYVIIVRLVIEWIVLVLDALILFLLTIFIAILIFVFHRKTTFSNAVVRITDFAEQIYSRLIELFHNKKTAAYGLAGVLIMHIIVDIGNFLIPYILPGIKSFYFSLLGHDLLMANSLPELFVLILNIFAMFFILSLPLYFWISSENKIHPRIMGLFWASMFIFLLMPFFRFASIDLPEIFGIDIQANALNLSPFHYLIALAIAFGIYKLKWKKPVKGFLFCVVCLYGITYLIKTSAHLISSIWVVAHMQGCLLTIILAVAGLTFFLFAALLAYPAAMMVLARKWFL